MDIRNIIEKEKLNLVYGEAAVGKTTLALQYSLSQKNKIIFIDVEKTASVERLKQLGGDFKDIIFFKPKNLEEQSKIIFNIDKISNVSLIVIDTLGYFYRTRVNKDVKYANNLLARQLKNLKDFTRKGITVIISNQVYSDMENNIKVVGGNMVRNWSDRIIQMTKEPRKIIVEKPNNEEYLFEIVNKGIIFS